MVVVSQSITFAPNPNPVSINSTIPVNVVTKNQTIQVSTNPVNISTTGTQSVTIPVNVSIAPANNTSMPSPVSTTSSTKTYNLEPSVYMISYTN
jgi:hypothetical protein